MKHIGHEIASLALEQWGGDVGTLEHIATSGNSVYRYRAGEGPRILRLTDPGHRTVGQNIAEMEFLLHLNARNVPACAPVPSLGGSLVEIVGECSASVLTWAPGVQVGSDSPYWNEAFFREWGRSLARIHAAARSYAGPRRWDWREEGLIANAERLIPEEDSVSRAEFRLVVERLEELPRTDETFGMIHADFGLRNFHYDPHDGIVSFDFGNCCDHWFVSDIAISLSTLRQFPDRDRYRAWIVEGYRDVFPIDDDVWRALSWFVRLRIIYVYLSRLKKFGPRPTREEETILLDLRERVAERFEWS